MTETKGECDKNHGRREKTVTKTKEWGQGRAATMSQHIGKRGVGRKRERKERRRRIGGVRRKDRGEVLLIHVCRKKRGRWCVFGEEGWFFEVKK